jgi:cell division protein FtsL
MNSVQRFTQAYQQAPWRKQLQLIGLFLLILIMGALVAGIYLSVTARASTVGRNIQEMRLDIEKIEREIEDLETELAYILSNTQMQDRAVELGFRPAEPGEAVYVVVPGYTRPEVVSLAESSGPAIHRSTPALPADYTQSLFDWLRERVFEPAAPLVREK